MQGLTFILGGARSGKSALAVDLARQQGGRVLYVATLQPLDAEMRERVARHRAERPADWTTLEEPLDLPAALRAYDGFDLYVLDCVTLWVSNLLLREQTGAEGATQDSLGRVLLPVRDLISWQRAADARLIVVSNEVGAGVVPEYALGRTYRDALGKANQLLAAAAQSFYYVFAGFYLDMKAAGARLVGNFPPPAPTGPTFSDDARP